MQWDGDNPKENWRRFKQHVELMFTGPLKSRTEQEKCSYLLIWVGQKGSDIYNTWSDISDDDRKKLETYYERFENHVSPKANPVFARFKFHSRVQESSETAEKFITALRILAQDCDFKDPEEMIRDRIVFGTNSLKVREKLISKGAKLTLDKAIEIARSHESSQAQLTAMAAETADGSIHLVQRRNQGEEPQDTQHQNHPPAYQVSPPFKPPRGTRACGNCGRPHNASAKCPAHGKTCLYCKKLNHFAEVCHSKARRQRIHAIEDSRDSAAETTFESIIFQSVTIANQTQGTPASSRDEVFVSLQVNLAQSDTRKTTLRAKLDTGAQGNILPMRLYREMFPHQVDNSGKLKPKALLSSNVVLTAYGGSQIKHHGIVTIPCTYRKESTLAPFYVTDIPGPAIIGLPTSTDLNLLQFNCAIQTKHPHISNHGCLKDQNLEQAKETTPIKDKQDLTQQYPECFNGIGKFQGEYHITVDPSVPPVIHPPRRVPVSLKDDIKSELDDMVKNGIITKLEEGEPTPWVNSLPTETKWEVETLLRPQRSQGSHPERTPCYPHFRRDLTQTDRSYSFLHC